METQRILMRSLAVVFFASVIWTITAGAYQKDITCCTFVSGLTREQFNDTIISYRMLKQRRECLKAIVFKTERGKFCFNWRLSWVKEEVKQLRRAQRNNSLTSTPAPASSISKLTPVGGQTDLKSRDSAGAEQKVRTTCCLTVSNRTREQFTDPIISFRLMLKPSPPCVKAVVFKTERGEFCFNWRLSWVKEEMKLLRAQRNKV